MTIYSQLEKSLLDWKAVPLQMALFTLYLRYHHHPEGDEVGTETILLFLQIFIKHLVLPGTTGASLVAQIVKNLPTMQET